jgi:hypothetical protein
LVDYAELLHAVAVLLRIDTIDNSAADIMVDLSRLRQTGSEPPKTAIVER